MSEHYLEDLDLANEPEDPRMSKHPIRAALQTMIASAEVYTEGDEVMGYRIKTGALHRLIGMLGLTIPAGLPIAAEADAAKVKS